MTQRPWFQIHLSTAIVLMFVAGGLMHLNLVPSNEQMPPWDIRLNSQWRNFPLDAAWVFKRESYGWPWTAMGIRRFSGPESVETPNSTINVLVDGNVFRVAEIWKPGMPVGPAVFEDEDVDPIIVNTGVWDGAAITLDSVCALLILFLFAFVLETRIRNREFTKKPASPPAS